MVSDAKRVGSRMDWERECTHGPRRSPFLDEVFPVQGFVSVAPVFLAWKDRVISRGEPEELVRLFHSDRMR